MGSADDTQPTAATGSAVTPDPDENRPDSGAPIECRPTRWFYRRMGLMTLLLIGLSLYFFYDGKYGYPKVNERAEVYDWFHDEVLDTYQKLDEQGRLAEWPEIAAEGTDPFGNQGWPVGQDGNEPRWPNYAASLGWSSDEPKRFSPEEIREQFHWGIGTMVVGLLVLGYALSQVPTRLRADAKSFTPPRGRPIRFDQVHKVDTRKWKQKGLAYAHFKQEDGTPRKATLDDLKYGGAQQVLDRLLANFSGELIEKVEDPAAIGDGDDPTDAPPHEVDPAGDEPAAGMAATVGDQADHSPSPGGTPPDRPA